MRALRDEQADRAISLQLQRQGPTKFQRRGQEHRSGDRLPKQLPDRLWIVRMRAQVPPSRIQAHPVPPNRLILNDKATDYVRLLGLFIHAPQNEARSATTQPSPPPRGLLALGSGSRLWL